MENVAACKGEALLLGARIKECEAAAFLADLSHGQVRASQADVSSAMSLLKDHWHQIPIVLKSKLAERNITVQTQTLLDVEHVHEDVGRVLSIVNAAFPVTTLDDCTFDGLNPTMYAVLAELALQIEENLELETFDGDVIGEIDAPFRTSAKASLGGWFTEGCKSVLPSWL